MSGSASGTIFTRITAAAPVGSPAGNVSLTSTGATTKNVAVTGTVVATTAPQLTVNTASLPAFTTTFGVASAEQTFSVSGINLTTDLTVTAPANFEIKTTGSYGPTVVLTPSSGTVLSTPVLIRISASALQGATSGNVSVVSSGAISRSVSFSGTVLPALTINYVSLTGPASPYTQNFDGLGTVASIANAFSASIGLQSNLSTVKNSSTLDGWYATKSDGTGTDPTPLASDTGSNASGGVYSYGASSAPDRALGLIASGTNIMTFGTLVKNNGATALTGLTFTFTAEFWRNSTAVQNILKCAYGKIDGVTFTNTNFLTASGATLFTGLDIVGPPFVGSGNGPLDGNVAPNKAAVSITLPISLAPGEVAFLRWSDTNDGGNDAGLAMDDLTIIGEDSIILIPTVSLPSGTYYTNQIASVSNYGDQVTAGNTLRYTLDGSDPTTGSTLYDNGTGIPIIVGTGTKTLKVAAFTAGNVRSIISSSTYILPQDVASLTALRASPLGSTIYRVTGQVTFTASLATRNTKFFQDSGAGIQIDDFSAVVTTTYTLGDNVANIVGTISSFNGQLQFTPRQDFGAFVSTGNAVVPLSRTVATLTDADQARLVSLTDVTFQSAGSAFGTAPSFTNIKDPSIAGFTGVAQNLFGTLNGSPIPTGPNTVTGVVQKTLVSAVQTFTVAPRNLADIVYTGPPLITAFTTKSTLLEGGTGLTEESALTITRTGSTAASLDVQLTESTTGALLVDSTNSLVYSALPQTLTIPIGQASATVYVVAANNAFYSGPRSSTLSASSAGFISGTQIFTITDDEANTYANWIAGFNVGAETGPNDDYDKDGIANTLENYMGSDPSVSNTGLTAVSGTATTLTFRHNRADAPATDVSASYEWSVDLVSWFPSGAGAGITVTIAPPTVITNGSPNDLVQVTATVTGGAATQLFARLKGVKAP